MLNYTEVYGLTATRMKPVKHYVSNPYNASIIYARSVVNGFSWPGWIRGYEDAARCDEHPFRAKIKVSAWTVFKLSLFDKVVWTKKERRITKMSLLLPHTFLFVFHVAFGHLYEPCWS